jgi:hypothetical protein
LLCRVATADKLDAGPLTTWLSWSDAIVNLKGYVFVFSRFVVLGAVAVVDELLRT